MQCPPATPAASKNVVRPHSGDSCPRVLATRGLGPDMAIWSVRWTGLGAPMISWEQVVAYATSRHIVLERHDDLVRLVVDLGNGRSQYALLRKLAATEGAGAWLAVDSPIGAIDELDLLSTLRCASREQTGGISLFGDLVVLRQTMHSSSLLAHEFDRDLLLLCLAADDMEKRLLGTDVF